MDRTCQTKRWMCYKKLTTSYKSSLLFAFLVVICPLSSTSATDSLFQAQDLLCVIKYYNQAGQNGLRGKALCNSPTPGIDFLFLGSKWYRNLENDPDCACDGDHDGLTACEEVLRCLNPSSNDTDGDCLGDGLEILLGLDPLNPDSDGDLVSDGDEDLDGNGVVEKNEDFDQDGLANCQEISTETNPISPDTDEDGWNDETEVASDKDPLNPTSTPSLKIVSLSTIYLSLKGNQGALPTGTVIASPPVNISLLAREGVIPSGTVIARPPITIKIEIQQ